ncbi:pyridoxamine 5'-phosphate oxidase family protein [Nocardiopsis sp. RSe5-2]|uniref:Pyridoxamine 5'-phosphate oxidase family protein n=2 Tax=Nocardiopsis endophytica TaxID=3018445 RepID=A0ABT4UBL2_9ACTN|nr:pyridoxamine 5'-phosphate oxidase family protein [Nocardiopsis endophytica]MDA2814361.1 pyridoxamine 5'-phosphate oxidase family protein [Nocardiopsis endophytica]
MDTMEKQSGAAGTGTDEGRGVPWAVFEEEAPELAARVRGRFERTLHHVLATLRSDGAPRVSGTEVQFYGRHLTLGSMPGAVKARDLQRDGRFALHANPGEVTREDAEEAMGDGDAKVSGTAVEVTDPEELEAFREVGVPPGPFHLFRLMPTGVVLTSVEDGGLMIRHWRPGAGVAEHRRT